MRGVVRWDTKKREGGPSARASGCGSIWIMLDVVNNRLDWSVCVLCVGVWTNLTVFQPNFVICVDGEMLVLKRERKQYIKYFFERVLTRGE